MYTLVIYDNTGKIWGMYSQDTAEVPEGLQAIAVQVPEGYHIYGIDLENKAPLYEKDTDEIGDLNTAVDDLFTIILND